MQKMIKRLSNNFGFTLMELVLSITIAGAIFGIASETMIRQADTYSFIASRKTSIADVRYALNRMAHEIMRLEAIDIRNISESEIEFVDDQGLLTTYNLGAHGSNLAIYRGNTVLVPKVESFEIEYQNGAGEALVPGADQISQVKRIKLSINTDGGSEEKNISVTTTIVPRSLIGYTNYQ